jgi:glycosidase
VSSKSLIGLSAVVVASILLSTNAVQSREGAVGAPSVTLSFYHDDGTYDDGSLPFFWDEDVYVSSSDTNQFAPVACPSTTTGASVFVSQVGSENTRSGWTASASAFLSGSKAVVSADVKLSGMTVGHVNDLKSLGGDWSIGIACTENSGAFVNYTIYRKISVTKSTGDWTSKVTSGTPTATSTTPAPSLTAGSSDEKVFTFVDGLYVSQNTTGTPFGWDQDVFSAPSSSNFEQPFTCPASSTGAFIFVADLGSERTKSSWIAFTATTFIANTQSVLQPNLKLSSLNQGSSAAIKTLGGQFSLGVGCTSNNATSVVYASFRVIQVAKTTGSWTAGSEVGGTITPTYTPSASPTATGTPTSSASPSASPSATAAPAPIVPAQTPEWVSSSTIYQVDIRQATAAGTFDSFQSSQLTKLKNLGIKAISLTPVTPISGSGHYGKSGSEYAVDDYHYLNPEFFTSTGTENEFIDLVYRAHLAGIKVIVGWNAQATGLDHPWTSAHKDWYQTDGSGNFLRPSNGMGLEKDKALLKFSNSNMRLAMATELSYWVKHFGVDGFHCANVANVPIDYWDRITAEVNAAVTPKLLWIADSYSNSATANSFSGGHNNSLFSTLNVLAKGKTTKSQMLNALSSSDVIPPAKGFKINYTNNNFVSDVLGSDVTRLGAAVKTAAVLNFTAPGVPMIFNGQEIGLSTSLKLTDKTRLNYPSSSTIAAFSKFYKSLISLRSKNASLGLVGTSFNALSTTSNSVVAYVRAYGNNRVIVIANLSSKPTKASVSVNGAAAKYFNLSTGKSTSVGRLLKVSLPKFGNLVLSSVAAN